MKRSEFVDELLNRALTPKAAAEWAATEAERRGARFDPEEEPLPKTLLRERELVWNGVFPNHEMPAIVDLSEVDFSSAAWRKRMYWILHEAFRRYNAWPELRALADLARRLGAPDIAKHLFAILDGKEPV